MIDISHNCESKNNSNTLISCGSIPFAFPGVNSVACMFSTMLDGDMAISASMDDETKTQVAVNRRKLISTAGLAAWVELKQVHKDHVVTEPEPTPLDEASTLEGDGACTGHRGIALVIKTADCQPILLTDRQGIAIAALHVGWRGNVIDFPAGGLRHFCEKYGISADEVLAVRGPSLGPGAAEFVNFDREWPPEFLPWFQPAAKTMDLWALTRHQLVQAGIRPEHIYSLDLCTYSLPGLFFSYRRGHAGRQVSMIWLR